MSDDIALSVKDLSKDFKLPHERKNTLKEWALHFRKPSYERFHALRDIDFEVKRGEFFGIVGRNGSGKSTLLKIIGGIYKPTKGSVTVNGTLTPFIELGIGFNPELTGRENIFLNGAILGLTRKEIVQKYDEIVDFAELEKFMDQKLKNYSSGMQVRLAFSIAIQAHNDILLIDEVLAVGDAAFQRKCYKVFKDIKRSGRTVVFVTHDMGAVQEYCDRAMMIHDSKVLAIGKPREVALRYEIANTAQGPGGEARLDRPANPFVRLDKINVSKTNLNLEDDLEVRVDFTVQKEVPIQLNLFLLRPDSSHLAGINTTADLKNFLPKKGKNQAWCTIKAGQLAKNDYRIGVAVYTLDDVPEMLDIIDINYGTDAPRVTVLERSTHQDGDFYIQGKWKA